MKARTKSLTNPLNRLRERSQNRLEEAAASTSVHCQLAAFPTSLGWIGLLGLNQLLTSVFVGHKSAATIKSAAAKSSVVIELDDWNLPLRQLLEAYSEGEIVDFSNVEMALPETTTFRRQIIAATRQLRYGETASYGELARRVGHPGAARAVGTVMSTNRFPILIPCHRVLAAGGKLGGYTSPSGTEFKRRLLDMEASAIRAV